MYKNFVNPVTPGSSDSLLEEGTLDATCYLTSSRIFKQDHMRLVILWNYQGPTAVKMHNKNTTWEKMDSCLCWRGMKKKERPSSSRNKSWGIWTLNWCTYFFFYSDPFFVLFLFLSEFQETLMPKVIAFDFKVDLTVHVIGGRLEGEGKGISWCILSLLSLFLMSSLFVVTMYIYYRIPSVWA
jgi:hypothetical protein